MSLPALSRVWQVTKNQVVAHIPGDGAASVLSIYFKIVAALLAFPSGGAHVVRSSNGSIASNANLWAGDPTTFAWAEDPGDATSWIQIALPGIGVNFQLLIACMPAGSDQKMAAWVTWDGFTGGTTTAYPTAPDMVQILGTAGAGATAFAGGATAPQADDSVVHVWHPTDGSALRALVYRGGSLDHVLQVEKPRTNVAAWNTPGFAKVTPGTVSAIGQLSTTALWSTDAGYRASVLYDGTPRPMSFGFTSEAAGTQTLGTRMTNGNKLSGFYPMTPIGLYTVSSFTADAVTVHLDGRHGEVADLWWAATGLPTGATFPGDGSRQFIKIEDLVFPWDGTASFLTAAP